MVGALSVAREERLAAGAEWSPYSQRQALVAEVHAVRQVARATRRHHEPADPAATRHSASPTPAATCTAGSASAAASLRS
jgi:hypothetical protein